MDSTTAQDDGFLIESEDELDDEINQPKTNHADDGEDDDVITFFIKLQRKINYFGKI